MKETYLNSCAYFNDFNDLKNQINFLLDNTLDRMEMSSLANNFVKNTFTFKHQVENIIKLAV